MTFYVVTETLGVYTPSSRRWPVTTGMELSLVNLLGENGNYATFSCTVSPLLRILPS